MFWLQGPCKSRSASSCTVNVDWISDCSFETRHRKGENCSEEQTDLEDREVSSLHPFQMIRGQLGVKTWKIAREIGNRQAVSLAALEGKGPAAKLAGDRY
jgi:hypothetical protein